MEATILLALQSLRLPVLTQIAALISSLANYGFIWIVLGLVMFFLTDRKNVGVMLVLTVIATGLIVGFILQPIFGHERPCDAGVGISAVMGVSRTGFSFPSFHATVSFACATLLAMLAGRRWGTWAFIGAALIAVSRLYLGVEWPLDVIFGLVFGVLIGIVSAWVYNQFLHDLLREYPKANQAKGGRKSVRSTSSIVRRKVK